MGDSQWQLFGGRQLTLSAFSHFHRRCLAATHAYFPFKKRVVDTFWNRKCHLRALRLATRGLPSDTRLLVSCQQPVKGLTPRDTRKLWTSVLTLALRLRRHRCGCVCERLVLGGAPQHLFVI